MSFTMRHLDNATTGECPIGEYYCEEENRCIPFGQPCPLTCTGDDCCYSDGKKCGDECIYKFNGDFEKYDCNGKCVLKNVKCDTNCPPGTFECGKVPEAKCVPEADFDLYRTCSVSGKCLTNSQPCGPDCPSGYIKCGEVCRKDTEYRECNGTCIENYQQCAVDPLPCPVGREVCGKKYCLSADPNDPYSTVNFKECDGKCQPLTEPCDRKCEKGYNFCNYTISGNFCQSCGACENVSINYDRCIREDIFDEVYQWCGDCDQCTLKSLSCPPHPEPQPSECPVEKPTKCQTIRKEGDEVIKEESSYDPNTRELTIHVPSHGSRPATTFIIGETVTAIVYPQECLVSNTPEYLLELLVGAESSRGSCNGTAELTENDLVDKYSYVIAKGAMSKAKIAELPLSIQNACKPKPGPGDKPDFPQIIVCEIPLPQPLPVLPNDTFIPLPGDDCPVTTPNPGCAKSKVSYFLIYS